MIIAINTSTQAQPISLNLNAGYSWVTGDLGAEIQYGTFAFGGGYYPAKYPMSNDPIPSISGHITWYGDYYYNSCYYITLGVAGAGYRYEDSNGHKESAPMTCFIFGYRAAWEPIDLKFGCGYGYVGDGRPGVFTVEAKLGFSLGTN